MRKLLIIVVLCCPCFGAFSIVQQVNGGSINQTIIATPSPCCTFSVTSSGGNFPVDTTSGNLLVFVGWVNVQCVQCGSIMTIVGLGGQPSTSGFTWSQANTRLWGGDLTGSSTPLSAGLTRIAYIKNASTMSSGTSTTWTVSVTVSSVLPVPQTTISIQANFYLLELSGISTSFTNPRTSTNAFQGSSLSNPSTGNVTAFEAGDFLVESYSGDLGSSYGSVGSGFTLLANASDAVGQSQYKIAVSGSNTGNSFSASMFNWSAVTAVFPIAAVPSAGVQRHHGTVF